MTTGSDSVRAGQWRFDGDVPSRFDAHIRRSVPFYEAGHGLIAQLSDFFVGPDALVYELGCATGTLTRLLGERTRDRRARVLGFDLEPAMIAIARERCRGLANVEVAVGDVAALELAPADMVVAYYTLQFLPPRARQGIVDRIYAALGQGGALLLFEKVRAPDARFQDLMAQLYTDFKLAQGFGEQEIIAKALSLRGVLEPFSSEANLDLMRRAGFADIMSVFKYVCFEGFLAIK